MTYKVLITVFYIISADQSFDKISNNFWSVLFVINKYDLFLNQIQNIIRQKYLNIKIIKNFDQIDNQINLWLQNNQHLALVIWDHKEKKEINKSFAEELGQNLAKINRKIDILCLDFCYSASFEIIINIMHQVDFVIANQDRQFIDGFYYDNLFENILNQQNPEKSCKDLAQEIVWQTCHKYSNTDQFNLINMVAIDCHKTKLIMPFINKLDKLKFNSSDLFHLIEKQFYCNYMTKFLINNIVIAQAKTGNYHAVSGISI